MPVHLCRLSTIVVFALLVMGAAAKTDAQTLPFIMSEQRRIEVRDPARLPRVRLPDLPPPITVSHPRPDLPGRDLSLDEAIRITLRTSEVIRVLTGPGAASSGRTVYDPAITNTQIDEARGRFDPALDVRNTFDQQESPQAVLDPLAPHGVLIDGDQVESYQLGAGLSKRTITGGTLGVGVDSLTTRSSNDGLLLNPFTRSSSDISYTQPLLQGGGWRANLAPIEIAQIETERSFFQLKESVQQMVRGVIEGYWLLRVSQVDVWARQQQVQQGEEAYNRAETSVAVGIGNAAEMAQARAALAGFRANLVSAQASLLDREAALRNIMGLPPSIENRVVTITEPRTDRVNVDWRTIVATAEQRRPDLIELKLILEADQQDLILARNAALPRLDMVGLYRWDGLRGRTPDQTYISSDRGDFTGWQLGVNFSVPLGLRSERAQLRRQELLLMRDRANLDQAIHNVIHILALSYRDLSQYFEQYQALREARTASQENLEIQWQEYLAGRTIYLNVLLAISEWGNSVVSEAQALAQYNVELANLDQQMGTILESHGIRFAEERYGSVGPLGRMFPDECYPRDMRPCPNQDRYPADPNAAPTVFDLDRSPPPLSQPEEVQTPPPESRR